MKLSHTNNHDVQHQSADDFSSSIIWFKNNRSATETPPNGVGEESYPNLRRDALQQREQAPHGTCPYDLDVLFQVCGDVLTRTFNRRMYDEFRHIAVEDAETRGTMVGMHNLIKFYDAAIRSHKPLADEIALDYINLVQNEAGKIETPAFDKLRATHRDGSWYLKNRLKVEKFIDPKLKTDLDS